MIVTFDLNKFFCSNLEACVMINSVVDKGIQLLLFYNFSNYVSDETLPSWHMCSAKLMFTYNIV